MRDAQDHTPLRERATVALLSVAPLRAYTGLVRALSRIPVPRALRRPILGSLGTWMGMTLGEAERPVDAYGSFQALFVRRLAAGIRPLPEDPDVVVSPVDGCVSQVGEVRDGALMQAKGIDYTLEELLGDRDLAGALGGGAFATLYLRPRDYHRIHAPVAGEVRWVRHMPGTLMPVQPHVVRNFKGLFARNERVVIRLETTFGPVALVCVAATGVRHISLAFGSGDPRTLDPDVLPLAVERGAEVAAFNLGSTVIVVFPPGAVAMEPLAAGQEIRMGQPLARARASGSPRADRGQRGEQRR